MRQSWILHLHSVVKGVMDPFTSCGEFVAQGLVDFV